MTGLCDSGYGPRTTPSSSLFEVGVRVILCGSHSHAGEEGVIVGSRARAFNGWTVRLDSSLHVGADEHQMVSERA